MESKKHVTCPICEQKVPAIELPRHLAADNAELFADLEEMVPELSLVRERGR